MKKTSTLTLIQMLGFTPATRLMRKSSGDNHGPTPRTDEQQLLSPSSPRKPRTHLSANAGATPAPSPPAAAPAITAVAPAVDTRQTNSPLEAHAGCCCWWRSSTSPFIVIVMVSRDAGTRSNLAAALGPTARAAVAALADAAGANVELPTPTIATGLNGQRKSHEKLRILSSLRS